MAQRTARKRIAIVFVTLLLLGGVYGLSVVGLAWWQARQSPATAASTGPTETEFTTLLTRAREEKNFGAAEDSLRTTHDPAARAERALALLAAERDSVGPAKAWPMLMASADAIAAMAEGNAKTNRQTALLDLLLPVDGTLPFGPASVGQARLITFDIHSGKQLAVALKRVAQAENTANMMPASESESALRGWLLRGVKERDPGLASLADTAFKRSEYAVAMRAASGISDATARAVAQEKLGRALLHAGEPTRALHLAQSLDDPTSQAILLSMIGDLYQAAGFTLRVQAIDTELKSLEDDVGGEEADEARTKIKAHLALGEAAKAAPPAKEAQTAHQLVESGKSEQIAELLSATVDPAAKDHLLAALATEFLTRQQPGQAVHYAAMIEDRRLRVRTFRELAERQAANSDFYNLLGGGVPAKLHPAALRLPTELPAPTADAKAQDAFEGETLTMVKERKDQVLIRTPPIAGIGAKLPPVGNADALHYTAATVDAKLPAETGFAVGRLYYQNSPYNLKFYFTAGNQDFVARQNALAPDVINLERGVVDLPTLSDQLKLRGLGEYLQQQPGTRNYVLRRPIVINPGATLVVSGTDVGELRLSQEAGAYVLNAGKLFVTGTRFTGWSEQSQSPAIVADEPTQFRPFLTSWSRSETYLAGSEFTALGYTASKSYGLTISSGPKQFVKARARDFKRPTAVIVDNSFRNLLYGFYCYEADDVVLVGNEYVDNYTYGIDPHDRSRRLLIAYNTTYDTHKKHGIIISREVNDSTILGNLTFRNHGSGIMIDRFSTGTLIYANSGFANEGDGLTVYESGCKLIAANRFFENRRAGIKVRNAMDVGIFFNELRGNKQAGVNGYIANLTEGGRTRDLKLDPYTDVTAIDLVGNLIQSNAVGVLANDVSALFLRSNRFLDQSPRLIRGTWNKMLPEAIAGADMEKGGLFMTERCVKGSLASRHQCSFRDAGFLSGDGQDSLADRVDEQFCTSGGAK